MTWSNSLIRICCRCLNCWAVFIHFDWQRWKNWPNRTMWARKDNPHHTADLMLLVHVIIASLTNRFSVMFLWQLQICGLLVCVCVYRFETEIRANGKFGNEIASTRIVVCAWQMEKKVSIFRLASAMFVYTHTHTYSPIWSEMYSLSTREGERVGRSQCVGLYETLCFT